MAAVTWIQGKDLITVQIGSTPIISSDLAIDLVPGHGAYLPAAPFFLFFPGNAGTGELPEYVYISAKSTDHLTINTPPFGNTGGNGRAALANGAPNTYTATSHPAGAIIQLRSTWETIQQIQTQLGAHQHTGGTGDGPQIDNSGLAANSVGNTQIGNNQVTSAKLQSDSSVDANRAVTTDHIKDSNITTAKIAANAVTSAKLASDAVTDANRAVTTDHIRDGAVNHTKIGTGEVITSNLANANVTAAKCASDVVVTTGNQSIAGMKTFSDLVATSLKVNVGSDATNDLYYRSSGGALTRLAAPSITGQVLGHASGVPTWGYAGAFDPTRPVPGIINLIDNGGMEVNQTGVNSWAAAGKHIDRWLSTNNGSRSLTSAAREFTIKSAGSTASLKFVVGGAGSNSNFVYITQRVETAGQYAGYTMTLAADVYSPAGSDGVMYAWDESTGALGTATYLANDAFTRYSVTFVMPAGHNVQARFDLRSNHTFYIDNVTMTPGVSAPWTLKPFGLDLIDCQRWYEVFGSSGTALSFGISGYAAIGQAFYNYLRYATTKYAAPTVTPTGTWNPTNTSGTMVISGGDDGGFTIGMTATATGGMNLNNFGQTGTKIVCEVTTGP